uniref:Uncharacterized protein n=1 Tax=Arundo donax TaxID=35708 RepID=A0A0A9HIS1_ARUDO
MYCGGQEIKAKNSRGLSYCIS